MTHHAATTPRPTVAASMLRSLHGYLAARGHDADALLQAAGLAARDIADAERAIEARHYERLLQAAIVASHNPLLGLEFGMAVHPERWGGLGRLLVHCATLGEAIAFQTRYVHLVNAAGRTTISEHDGETTIEWRDAEPTMPALVEEAFAAWVGFARWASQRDRAPIAVSFRHRAQGDPAVYRAFFRCPVHFEAPGHRLRFDSELLAAPLRSPDAVLATALAARVDTRQARHDSHALVAALQDWIAARLAHGAPGLADAAAAMNLGERSLQQQLHDAGTGFRQCVDDTRRRLAERHLRDASLSIGDIGLRLGFSEQSAFQRAFRRWHGLPPAAWRRRNG
ncbi:hypothetical protein SAOR_14240 [Salinisphaera orenii MK-B5]|uniref:HTH araC/xylS-type domain-containing protein n=1 Tax=Salinisphaera orenii MK-B5 TaxID=856730 RepID=A0A423PGR1_9GAMM|nr:AraC family transcriptional regulator [Salinisphaera orenii]ROO24754.1 hypothetical protein SAOR_14240 [Salinisphaera orenii MK-B5]